MTPYSVVVVAFAAGRGLEEDVSRRLGDGWTTASPLHCTTGTTADLEQGNLTGLGAAVLLLGPADDAGRVLALLATLEDAGVAAMILLQQHRADTGTYEYAGALVESLEADDALIVAKLQGLLHRKPEIERLRDELAIAHRFHGGLKGEIVRMHEEMQLAAIVQREFLPRSMPDLHGMAFGALWRPANYVSGDIYDVIRLDDDHVGVFLADAVGHGVPAALMTMVICRSLTTKVIKGSHYQLVEPSDVLARLNHDMIRRQGRTTRFATAAYALINCRSRMVRLACAGHPPPLRITTAGTCEQLETSGGLLGVFDDEIYDQIEFEFALDDRMVIYSDGFEQAFPNPTQSDYQRRLPNSQYRDEFETLACQSSPADMVLAVGQRLDDQQGSLHQVDDLTMICVHAGSLPQTTSQPSPAQDSGAHSLRLT